MNEQNDLQQGRRQVAVVALAVVFITLTTALIQSVCVIAVQTFFPSVASEPWFTMVISTLPMHAVAMPLSLLIYRFAKADPPERRRMKPLTWLGLLCVCFAMTYVGNIIGTVVNAVIGAISGEPPVNDLENLTLNTPLWANFLFVGAAAPIMEEIFYRKMVIDRLRAFGELPAILLSGLLFGLIHGNFGQFFYATMMGMVFGLIYLRTGKLRYSIGLHMAINLVGAVYTGEILKRFDLEDFLANPSLEMITQNVTPILMLLAYFAFISLCFVAAPVAVFFLRKHLRFRKADPPRSAADWAKILALNPAVWSLLALAALMFIA